MKILFIGHYRENSGWADASKNYILAMQEANIDVVCRNITLTKDSAIPKQIEKLEKKSTDNVDICIQHVLPHHIIGTNYFKKNIALLAYEATSIKNLAWYEYLKLVDEIWVPNTHLKQSLIKDELNNINVIPHCFDLEKYAKKYQSLNIPEAENTFKFYYIGDWNDRKNLGAIIRAFNSEFDDADNVSLIIKINKFAYNADKLMSDFQNFIENEKKKLRIYPSTSKYKKEIIITTHLLEEQLCSLHQYCDCFICPSFGEAWSIPSFEAMAFGNTPICTNFGGPAEFIDKYNKNTGCLVDGVEISCVCSDAAFPELFTAKNKWVEPSEGLIRQHMRYYYENKNRLACKKDGLQRAQLFSFDRIGKLIKERLNECANI